MKSLTHYIALLALSGCLNFAAKANESDESELNDLLALLEEQTELATQSKMNADYVPGMVTILHGSDLTAYGASTVADALDSAAGFYMSVDNAGTVVATVRGVGATLNATNIKVMLNGVAMNRPYDGSSEWLLRLPLEQVDRIEIIRGPGSSLYGEYAFTGVVNVITKKANMVSLKVGSFNSKQGDLLTNHEFDSGAKLVTNVSVWDRDNSGILSNLDDFAGQGFGYSPGNVYDHENGLVLLAETDFNGYKVQLNLAEIERGGWYGRTAVLPQDLEPRVEKITGFNFSKSWELSESLSLGIDTETLRTNLKLATFLPIPLGVDPPGPPPPITTELYRRQGSEDSLDRFRLNLRWSVSDHHDLYFELGHTSSEVDSFFIERYELGEPSDFDFGNPIPDRSLSSFTFQDQWKVNDNLEITLGARHDDYNDWGSHTSPRIAAVWREGENHIFKFQFADAFRPPTMRELNPDSVTESEQLTEERLDSLEFSYIFRDPGKSFRFTAFKTEIKDLIEFFIRPGDAPVFRNVDNLELIGVEFEWQQKIDREWEWYSNLSYSDVTDEMDDDQKLSGSIEWLANLGLRWSPDSDMLHAIHLRYVGKQEGWELPPIRAHNDHFDSYSLVNYSLSVQNIFDVSNLELNLGVSNLFDESYDVLPNPAQYPTGLHRGKRSAWLKFSYEF